MTKTGSLYSYLFLSFVVLFVSSHSYAATTYTWYGGSGYWEVATNWNPVHVPNHINDDIANVISSGGAGNSCNISANISLLVPIFGLGYGLDIDTPCTVNINSGASLTTNSELIISLSDNSYAVTNVYGSAYLASLRIAGERLNTKGVLNIDGGYCEVKWFGTYIGCNFYGTSTGGQGRVNLTNNGTLTINGTGLTENRLDFGANGQINIEEGTLAVKDNQISLLQGYIDDSKIVSYEGQGVLICYFENGYTYVKTYNLKPRVDAGPSVQKVVMSSPSVNLYLDGVVTDDGRPTPANLSINWTVEDAPDGAVVNFTPSAAIANPTASFDVQGTYRLRLTADDGEDTDYDEIIVFVYPEDYVGLTAQWSFEEGFGSNTADSVGDADGTLVGNPAWVVDGGQVGNCIDFDGINDYVNCGVTSGSILDGLSYQISISAWIKPRITFGNNPAIISKGSDAWRLQWNDDLDRIEFVGEGLSAESIETKSTSVDLEDGRWHQIFLTYDGIDMVIYVDGIQEAGISSAGLINLNSTFFIISFL